VAFGEGGSGSRVGDVTGVMRELGDHLIAGELEALGLPATPGVTAWMERMQAIIEASASSRAAARWRWTWNV
jgi:hypothetical protein